MKESKLSKENPFQQDWDNILERLKKVSFLRSFKKDFLTLIIQSSKIRQYEADEMIISENSNDKWVYILLLGEVKITKKGEEVAHLNNIGDIFGEVAVINQEMRTASVVAEQKTYCMAIDAAAFDQLQDEDRHAIYSIIYRLFAELLAERLKETTKELVRLQNEISFFKKCAH